MEGREFTLNDYIRIASIDYEVPGGVEKCVFMEEAYALGFDRGREGVVKYPLQRIIDILSANLDKEKTVRFSISSEGYLQMNFRNEVPGENTLTLLPEGEEDGDTWEPDPEDPLFQIINLKGEE